MNQRIVHISYGLKGGAGNALRRHSQELRDQGIDSQIIVADKKKYNNPNIHQYESLITVTKWDKLLKRIGDKLYSYIGDNYFSGRLTYKVLKSSLVKQASIVELRMIHSGGAKPFFNINALRLIKKKKIIWRLSDMWAFTGFCPYDLGCEKFVVNCGKCPQLTTEKFKAELPRPKFDFSRYQQFRKKRAYKGLDVTFVGPSTWMTDSAKKSILRNDRIVEIPVGVNIKTFSDKGKDVLRKKLGIPLDTVLLACNIPNVKNYRKAYELLEQSLIHLEKIGKNQENVALLIIGASSTDLIQEKLKMPIFVTGYLTEDLSLAQAYSAADIFLFPSRADNSAQVLLESASCGLPTICFGVTGNTQYVLDKTTGVNISPYNTEEFAISIENLIQNSELRRQYSQNARNLVVSNFSAEFQVAKFMELYLEKEEHLR